MRISDEEIKEIARQRSEISKKKRNTTIYSNPEHEMVGVCGEIALREFFGIMEHPPAVILYGDGGKDVSVYMRDRQDRRRELRIDVKCAINPTYLWVERPVADVYALAQFFPKKRAPLRLCAELIKWHWGDVVRAAPKTFEGKWHHSIPQGQLLELKDLCARYHITVRLCGVCGDWGHHERDGKLYCFEHKPWVLL